MENCRYYKSSLNKRKLEIEVFKIWKENTYFQNRKLWDEEIKL